MKTKTCIIRKAGWLGFAFATSLLLAGCDEASTTSSNQNTIPEPPAADEVYLCQSPASTLRLSPDKTAGMMIRGSAFEGHWSKEGQTIEFKPETGAPSKFQIQPNGSLVDQNYGLKFERLPTR